MTTTTPWKDGIWVDQDKSVAYLMIINGTSYTHKGFIHFDYPDCKTSVQGTLEYGDFGECDDAIKKFTGATRYIFDHIWVSKLFIWQNPRIHPIWTYFAYFRQMLL